MRSTIFLHIVHFSIVIIDPLKEKKKRTYLKSIWYQTFQKGNSQFVGEFMKHSTSKAFGLSFVWILNSAVATTRKKLSKAAFKSAVGYIRISLWYVSTLLRIAERRVLAMTSHIFESTLLSPAEHFLSLFCKFFGRRWCQDSVLAGHQTD